LSEAASFADCVFILLLIDVPVDVAPLADLVSVGVRVLCGLDAREKDLLKAGDAEEGYGYADL
jgi:hypothetical protein